jgi:precorrin-8X/cobalt-precorrin-8 methylmutase
VTRAEVAVDYGLAVAGPKLMVVGSAPAAINRIITRRQHEPLSDVCVLAAPTGFASVVQMKERLMDSDLTSIIVRGKKGGVQATAALLNAILREIAENPNN